MTRRRVLHWVAAIAGGLATLMTLAGHSPENNLAAVGGVWPPPHIGRQSRT